MTSQFQKMTSQFQTVPRECQIFLGRKNNSIDSSVYRSDFVWNYLPKFGTGARIFDFLKVLMFGYKLLQCQNWIHPVCIQLWELSLGSRDVAPGVHHKKANLLVTLLCNSSKFLQQRCSSTLLIISKTKRFKPRTFETHCHSLQAPDHNITPKDMPQHLVGCSACFHPL